MMLPVTFERPRNSAWLIACRSMARLAASRTRRSAHGDLASHWSAVNCIHCVQGMELALRVSPGVRLSSSARTPRIE